MNEIIHANDYYGVPKITKEDIINVATSVSITLTDKEIEWVLLCYEDAQRQDPSGTWNLVVEDLAYQAVNFRKYQEEADEESEETRRDFGNDDYIPEDDLPPINNFHTDGDGDDNTLLNFMGGQTL